MMRLHRLKRPCVMANMAITLNVKKIHTALRFSLRAVEIFTHRALMNVCFFAAPRKQRLPQVANAGATPDIKSEDQIGSNERSGAVINGHRRRAPSPVVVSSHPKGTSIHRFLLNVAASKRQSTLESRSIPISFFDVRCERF